MVCCWCTGVCVRSRVDLTNLLQAVPPQKGEATVNWYCYQKPCFLRCFSSADLQGPLHKYIISSPGFIIHLFLSCSPVSNDGSCPAADLIRPAKGERCFYLCRMSFQNSVFNLCDKLILKKMYPEQCVVCWNPVL